MDERSLIIIPTYEESANIAAVLRRTRASAPTTDVLVVDDTSPDGTATVVREIASELGQITLLERPEKTGLGSAYRAGFEFGLDHGYDVLVEMDADLSHDPIVIPELLQAVANGADLAIGSRYVPGGATPGWSRHRRLLSRAGNWYARRALGLDTHDATSGFRAYRASIVRAIDAASTRATGYGFQIELAYLVARRGGSIAEVPIEFVERTSGASKMSARITAEALLLVTGWALRDRLLQSGQRRLRRSGTGAAVAA
jgi:dolichol-phosphate mannosyltransferase